MGKVYLCQGRLAKNPLFISQLGIQLYSAEELCYFLVHYLNMIETSFFESEQLYHFLSEELEMEELVSKLKRLSPKTQLAQMILTTVQECNYLSYVELSKFKDGLNLKSQAKPWEVMKSRADFLASEGRYYHAIGLYDSILLEHLEEEVTSDFIGRIYFNKAMAYWQLFEFENAIRQMESACRLLKNTQAMKNLYFLHLQNPDISVDIQLLNNISNESKKIWASEWKQKEQEVEEVVAQMNFTEPSKFLEEWKEEYRKMRE